MWVKCRPLVAGSSLWKCVIISCPKKKGWGLVIDSWVLVGLAPDVVKVAHFFLNSWETNVLGGSASCVPLSLARFLQPRCVVGSEHQPQIPEGGQFGAGICETAAKWCRDLTGGSAGAHRLNAALFRSLPERWPQKHYFTQRPPTQNRTNPAVFTCYLSLKEKIKTYAKKNLLQHAARSQRGK